MRIKIGCGTDGYIFEEIEKVNIRYSDWEDYICYVKSLIPQIRVINNL